MQPEGSGDDIPTVVSEFQLSNAFLGKIIEVCIVTEDHHRAMAGLVRLGIGPFRVYTFDDETLAAPTYRGERTAFSLKVGFAKNDDLDVGDHATAGRSHDHARVPRFSRRGNPPRGVRLQWNPMGTAHQQLPGTRIWRQPVRPLA